jgi:hypothetical protein
VIAMRRPCLFKERDVKRAARAVLAMGLNIARIEIDQDGRIVVVPGEPESEGDHNPWDAVLTNVAHKKRSA